MCSGHILKSTTKFSRASDMRQYVSVPRPFPVFAFVARPRVPAGSARCAHPQASYWRVCPSPQLARPRVTCPAATTSWLFRTGEHVRCTVRRVDDKKYVFVCNDHNRASVWQSGKGGPRGDTSIGQNPFTGNSDCKIIFNG